MLKQISIAALAAVSMCAFAQNSSTWSDDGMNKNDYNMRKHVEWRGNGCLSGGDRYELAEMLDRAPMSVEHCLLLALTGAHKQAVMINDKMLAVRFPADSTTTMATTVNNNGTTTTTTTTTDTWSASSMDWSGEEAGSRPMRLIMTNAKKPKDIDYDETRDILLANLNDTDAAIIADWWRTKANERQRDIIVRLLKDDARMADQIYYPSVYMHRTYSWVNGGQ